MRQEKLPAKRLRVLAAILAFWGLVIAVRLCILQVVESKSFIERASQQQSEEEEITPRRGEILDREGKALARSALAASLVARPREIKNPAATAKALAQITGEPAKDLLSKLKSKKRYLFLKREISPTERKKIEALGRLPGISLDTEFDRFYPTRDMAAHVLGYVDVDEVGMSGLERTYNKVIHGEPGKVVWLVDANGNSYQREQQLPLPGATITTTIDSSIQHIVHKELRAAAEKTQAERISIIVMDPNSGAILAMANSPSFNPNVYARFPQSSWALNPSVALTYEPGSTFKMVTIAAALEEGLATPGEKIFCENGAIYIGKRKIDDHDPYGFLTVSEIMQNSSNVGTIKLGQRVGAQRLKYYVERYGFGQKTSVDLPGEVTGQVPGGDWSLSTLASVSIGHEISVTPLQTATIVSTVANGGIRYKPYVVQRVDDPRAGVTEIKPGGTRVMAEKTALEVRQMLEDVVTDGTAKTSRLAGYRAAGKTGTAQKFDDVNGGYFRSKYVSSFAGFVPVSNPKFTIVVVIDDPKGRYYGGEVAAPVFKRIAEQVLRNKSIAPDDPNYHPGPYTASPDKKQRQPSVPPSPRKPEVQVLDVTTRSAQSASGFEFGQVIVPDFTGQSVREVIDESSKLGLTPRISGSGRVVSQSPSPGAAVRPGTRIQFKFSLNN